MSSIEYILYMLWLQQFNLSQLGLEILVTCNWFIYNSFFYSSSVILKHYYNNIINNIILYCFNS